jgi:ketosteroid isomerase-like protein
MANSSLIFVMRNDFRVLNLPNLYHPQHFYYMDSNAQVMEGFYTCFGQRDWQGMTALYSDDIVFSDPAFGVLQGGEAKAMWEMLCKGAKDFSLSFSDIQIDGEYGTCQWVAQYTFSGTGRRVTNRIKAHMRFADGHIIEHTDEFSLYRWMRMALGLPGTLLGWSGLMQRKVQRGARERLRQFMQRR